MKENVDQWVEKMKVREWLQALSPVLAPAVMFGLWLGFAKLDKRADALSKLIAITEPIPTVDLSLPKPVVLASLYHSTEDALKMIDALIEAIKELPDTLRDIFDDVKEIIPEKEDVIDPIVEPVKETKDAIDECIDNAVKNLGYAYYIPGTAPAWVLSCLIQKGLDVNISDVKRWMDEKSKGKAYSFGQKGLA
jgi:hypothetical protein